MYGRRRRARKMRRGGSDMVPWRKREERERETSIRQERAITERSLSPSAEIKEERRREEESIPG